MFHVTMQSGPWIWSLFDPVVGIRCTWERLDDRCWLLTDIKGTSSVLYDVNKKHQVSLIRKKDWGCYCVYIFYMTDMSVWDYVVSHAVAFHQVRICRSSARRSHFSSCHETFIHSVPSKPQPCGSMNWIILASLIGNQSKCRLCPFDFTVQ